MGSLLSKDNIKTAAIVVVVLILINRVPGIKDAARPLVYGTGA